MRRSKLLYLAGPDRYYPEAEDLLARKRALCDADGLSVRVGGDAVTLTTPLGELQAREAYAGALANLRACDAVIANLTPWRGAGCDPATAFEVGFAGALGKPVLAYMNLEDEDDADYRSRVEAWIGASPDVAGGWRDANGCAGEEPDLPESALLWGQARRLFVVITPGPLRDGQGDPESVV